MQLLPDSIVSLRRCRWRIVAVRAFDGCELVTLRGLAAPWFGVERRILAPFDRCEPIERGTRPRRVGRRQWRHACRGAIASDVRPGGTRGALAARIDVLPYQLEPALAIARGHACRILIADEVGLGKTIQAALVAADLRARGAADRVLVLTPAGLRDQWQTELRDRFAVTAALVDAHTLRMAIAALPPDVNPWTTFDVALVSIDFVKRPDVLLSAAATPWDLVIVDEAHGAATDSDRRAAVEMLCSRAAYVVLLTATPHSGDPNAFAALCRLGQARRDEPLLVFRRTRADAGFAGLRRVRTLRVRINAHERRLHLELRRYGDAVLAERPDAWLALSVLHKRALSSAGALADSIDRRLATLDGSSFSPEMQLSLPLDAVGEATLEDVSPAWAPELALSSIDRERRLLAALGHAARRAAARESKIAALGRLLRRVRESVLVFTEYRDTLRQIQRAIGQPTIALHGGMTRDERRAAVDAFTATPPRVMLATDAAGEGLNLQATCRLVINIELPWNPMRLEQRIGRVDRIGQLRRVHAIHFVARGTREMALLERLRDRVSRARATIGAPDPVGTDEERAAAEIVVLRRRPAAPGRSSSQWTDTFTVDLAEAARVDAEHIATIRRCIRGSSSVAECDVSRPAAVIARGALRRRLAGRRLEIWRLSGDDERGRRADTRIVGVLVAGAERLDIDPTACGASGAALDEAQHAWSAEVDAMAQSFWSARLGRDVAILDLERTPTAAPEQAPLFPDRRLARNRRLAAADQHGRETTIERRMADARAAMRLTIRPPELLLVVYP